jgi:hypothetical protein
MFVRLYPDKYSPVPADRAVILARSAHAGFDKAIVKVGSKTKPTLVKFLIKLFSKSLWGVGQRPTTCIRMRKSSKATNSFTILNNHVTIEQQ